VNGVKIKNKSPPLFQKTFEECGIPPSLAHFLGKKGDLPMFKPTRARRPKLTELFYMNVSLLVDAVP